MYAAGLISDESGAPFTTIPTKIDIIARTIPINVAFSKICPLLFPDTSYWKVVFHDYIQIIYTFIIP
jgi:hypothetical protein